MAVIGMQIIGNKFSAEGNKVFYAKNPADGNLLLVAFCRATEAELNEAACLAEKAYKDYRKLPAKIRAGFLETIGNEIELLGDLLINIAHTETGLPLARLQGERSRTIGQLNLFAKLLHEGSWVNARIDTALPDRQPIPRPDIRMMQVALGPVAVFGASNFPLAFSVAGGDTASALAAGCPVVVKAHPAHPGTSDLVGQAICRAAKKCGLPDGVFSLLQDDGFTTGMNLVKHPAIKAVGFTGSFRGGKAIYDAAQQRPFPIPVFAEMGSANPVFVLPGAMKENGKKIALDYAASVTQGVGQFCTNPGLMVVLQEHGQSQFPELLKEQFTLAAGGIMLTEAIQQTYRQSVFERTKEKHLEVLASGLLPDGHTAVQPLLFRTTARTLLTNPVLSDEIFGPCSLVVEAGNRQEIIEVAESMEGHLTMTIHGSQEDLEANKDLIAILEQKAGRLIINGFPTGVEVCHAMVHGGPFPATTAPSSTSVGTYAIYRFTRPVCYQNFPSFLLPEELKDENPLGIMRLVNGEWIR
ncbi:aldehyde dehydrogenase (NADP(+)) [Flavihumibacter sp. RY-1]|uniref:Aldehyde dehydrogenase (NADP(+)) n=1 Tax=Flavihumibacter fluminis TaxID=2909236 RepID=A0ABS9BEY6_9BACT|nr:aldehyde dehydrogenase (NADP(+)) [Flavihumibacter fluminis]MCF1713689.1 aldehyde dehydrogenase (NADP(+)) [Flavihumibacter fluminis]